MSYYARQLRRALASAHWEEASDLLKEEGGIVLAKEKYRGDLPLHVALKSHANQKVIDLIVSCYPDAVKTRDSKGSLPIHLAIEVQGDAEMANLLALKYPESFSLRDAEGNLPIHLAAAKLSAYVKNIAFLDKSISMLPEGIKLENNDGNLPIHCAASNESTYMLSHIVSKFLDGVKYKNRSGSLPIRVATRADIADNVLVLAEKHLGGGAQELETSTLQNLLSIYCANTKLPKYRMNVFTKLIELIKKSNKKNDANTEALAGQLQRAKAKNTDLTRSLTRHKACSLSAVKRLKKASKEKTHIKAELESLQEDVEKLLQRVVACANQDHEDLEDNKSDEEQSNDEGSNQEDPNVEEPEEGEGDEEDSEEEDSEEEDSEEGEENTPHASIVSMKELLMSVTAEVDKFDGNMGILKKISEEARKSERSFLGLVDPSNQAVATSPDALKVTAQSLMARITALKQTETEDDTAQKMFLFLMEDPEASSRQLMATIEMLNEKLCKLERLHHLNAVDSGEDNNDNGGPSSVSTDNGSQKRTAASSPATPERAAKLPRVSLS